MSIELTKQPKREEPASGYLPDGNYTRKTDTRGSRRRKDKRVEKQVSRVKGEWTSFELDKIKFLVLDWTGVSVTYK